MEEDKRDDLIKKAKAEFERVLKKAQMISETITDVVVKELPDVVKEEASMEEARLAYMIAKVAVAKAMISLATFSYQEEDFIKALDNAQNCVHDELIPMLINKEPCGRCEECRKGNKSLCINPKVRDDYAESRFLLMLCGSLIEYDAWTEVLNVNIHKGER